MKRVQSVRMGNAGKEGTTRQRRAMAVSLGLVALVGWTGLAKGGLTPAAKCEALKNKEAGKYALCLQTAELKLRKTKGICSSTITQTCYRDAECPSGETCDKDATRYLLFLAKCEQNFAAHWAKWEQKAMDAGGSCPTTGDEAEIQSDTTADMSFLALKLSGVRFVDNGDGTATDTQTGLMWEQKTGTVGLTVDCSLAICTDPHGVNNGYKWSTGSPYGPTGGIFTDFLAKLNGGTSSDGTAISGCFAGHCDWRLPTVVELQTIVDPLATGCGSAGNPCIDPALGPTRADFYWSSITDSSDSIDAWTVNFEAGNLVSADKRTALLVRAVRSAQ